MPHIDLARHATVHQLGARDPLDAFLDIVTAQSITGQKTFTKPPYLGTAPTIGSHWARGSYVQSVSAVAGSSFVALMQSRVFVNVVAGGGTISLNTVIQSQRFAGAGTLDVSAFAQTTAVVARAGGSFTPSALAQSIGTHS